jgi:hypothetical protein
MWFFLFIIGIIGALFLFVHINLELNTLQKTTDNLTAEIKKHYGLE